LSRDCRILLCLRCIQGRPSPFPKDAFVRGVPHLTLSMAFPLFTFWIDSPLETPQFQKFRLLFSFLFFDSVLVSVPVSFFPGRRHFSRDFSMQRFCSSFVCDARLGKLLLSSRARKSPDHHFSARPFLPPPLFCFCPLFPLHTPCSGHSPCNSRIHRLHRSRFFFVDRSFLNRTLGPASLMFLAQGLASGPLSHTDVPPLFCVGILFSPPYSPSAP